MASQEVDELDIAIKNLTQRHSTKVLQSNPAGITCISEVDHDPLLLRLRDAVAGGTARHAGSTQGREKIPLNPGALILFDRIAVQVNEWYLALPDYQRRHLPISDRLATWYVHHLNALRASKVTDEQADVVRRTILGWSHSIEAMFDPPQVLELTVDVEKLSTPVLVPRMRRRRDPRTGRVYAVPVLDELSRPIVTRLLKGFVPAECPECHERYAYDPTTGDQMCALIVEYRDLGPETLDHAIGRCRACEEVWRGRDRIRALRWAIDQQEAQGEDDTPRTEPLPVSAR